MSTSKTINEMSQEELEAEIAQLQQYTPPPARTPRQPKRLDDQPKRKRTWRDALQD